MRGKKLLYSDGIGYYDGYQSAFSMINVPWNDSKNIVLGKKLTSRPGVFEVPVQNEWVGKVIKVASAYPGISFLNIPNHFSLQPFDYKE